MSLYECIKIPCHFPFFYNLFLSFLCFISLKLLNIFLILSSLSEIKNNSLDYFLWISNKNLCLREIMDQLA